MLSGQPKPDQPAAKCDSARVFLYDMGFVNRLAYGKEFVPLVSASEDFYPTLRSAVDVSPTRVLATVHLFYVRDGQRVAGDILQNHHNLQNSSVEFCSMLDGLGMAGIEWVGWFMDSSP